MVDEDFISHFDSNHRDYMKTMYYNHYSAFYSQYERGYNSGRRASYLFTGHFLNYDNSHAHNKGLLVSPPSFSRLKVYKNLHIVCDTFYSDEVE